MMSENILSVFKKELGYVNATNQYVELSIRITEKEHSLDLKNDLRGLILAQDLAIQLPVVGSRTCVTTRRFQCV